MSALPPADAARLVKFLGMLGSDQDGERASAGAMANRLLTDRGLTWADVIAAPPVQLDSPHSKARRRAMYPDRAGGPEPAALTREHQRTALRLIYSATVWALREREFLSGMAERRDRPTDKQAAWLLDLEAKARRQRAERERSAA